VEISELLKKLQSCKTVKDFADASIELLGNPMQIFDCNMRLLECTDYVTDDVNYNYLRENKFPDPKLAKDFSWQRRMKDMRQYREVHEEEFLGMQFMSKVLRMNDLPIGEINVASHLRPITQEDHEILELISIPLTMAVFNLQSFRAPMESELEYCLTRLLAGESIPDEVLERRSQAAGWSAGTVKYVLCANGQLPGTDYSRLAFQPILEPTDISVQYQNYLVIVLSREERLTPQQLEDLEQLLEVGGVSCGLSQSFRQMSRLQQHFEEARLALDIGDRVAEGQHLYPYEVYFDYVPIARQCQGENVLPYLPQRYQELIRLDREQHLELLKTLQVYLRENRSYQKTAECLHVHRNTVAYRIGKCMQVLGMSLSDGRNMLQLAHVIRVLEYLDSPLYFS
jgi:hypothetical protein